MRCTAPGPNGTCVYKSECTTASDCTIAEDCREARAQIVDVRPDLMLVDWMLPDMSGFDVCRVLRSKAPTSGVPIVMLTGLSDTPRQF